jgi:hypothetical protein
VSAGCGEDDTEAGQLNWLGSAQYQVSGPPFLFKFSSVYPIQIIIEKVREIFGPPNGLRKNVELGHKNL